MKTFKGPPNRMLVHSLLYSQFGPQNGSYQWRMENITSSDADILVRFSHENPPLCENGSWVNLSISAAPRKSCSHRVDGERKTHVTWLTSDADRRQWFERVMEEAGLAVVKKTIEVDHRAPAILHKNGPKGKILFPMPWCEFRAEARVRDEGVFRNRMNQTIGRGGAYGLGMLIVK